MDAALYEPKSRIVFALTQHARRDPTVFSPRRAGLDHVAFGVADREQLEAWVMRLDELGIVHSGIQDYGYADAIPFSDPDGIALELFWSKR